MRPDRCLALLLVALLVPVLAACSAGSPVGGGGGDPADTGRVPAPGPAFAGPRPPPEAFSATVERVVDGDTVVARVPGRASTVRVRLIGVDTPEDVKPGTPVRCYGRAAARLAGALLPAGAQVRADYEPGGRTDRYGRDLWDVWLPDGRFLQGVLVTAGAARAYRFPPQVEHAPLLASLAGQARGAGRGLWGSPCRGDSFGKGLRQ